MIIASCYVTYISADCSMYGVCGVDGKLKRNCPYHGRAKTLPRIDDRVSSTLGDLHQLCPHLFATGKDFGPPQSLATSFQTTIRQYAATQSRSATWKSNSVCRVNSCHAVPHVLPTLRDSGATSPVPPASPHSFTSPLPVWTPIHAHQTTPNTQPPVEYYVRRSFIADMFESCRGVRSMGSDYALTLVCGMPVAECTPTKWLAFMGTTSHALGIPFDIDFIQTDDIDYGHNYTALAHVATPCYRAPSADTSSVFVSRLWCSVHLVGTISESRRWWMQNRDNGMSGGNVNASIRWIMLCRHVHDRPSFCTALVRSRRCRWWRWSIGL